jgi:hypothetical protein
MGCEALNKDTHIRTTSNETTSEFESRPGEIGVHGEYASWFSASGYTPDCIFNCLAHFGIVWFADLAHVGGKIRGPHEQSIDSLDFGDGLYVVDATAGLYLKHETQFAFGLFQVI